MEVKHWRWVYTIRDTGRDIHKIIVFSLWKTFPTVFCFPPVHISLSFPLSLPEITVRIRKVGLSLVIESVSRIFLSLFFFCVPVAAEDADDEAVDDDVGLGR